MRETFDQAASTYHRFRPRYPDTIFDRLHEVGGLDIPADVLEIGPATGIATEAMAKRGHDVTAVELGAELAAKARAILQSFPTVTVVNASFDTWEPERWGVRDLVFAATAWHWLNPETRYQRAHRHLRVGGVLAFWSALHVVPDGGDTIFADLQSVYDEIGMSLPAERNFPRPGELPAYDSEIRATGLFDPLTIEHFDWEIVYDSESYLGLLDTFSGHIAMEPWKRDRLHEAIRGRLAQRSDGRLRRHWGCVLHVARAL